MIRAFNREGEVDSSSYAAILYAAVPSVPGTAPVVDSSSSNSTHLVVTLTEMTSVETSNSDIQAYSLEIDDGKAGNYSAVDSPSMVTSFTIEVTRRLTYRLRYRAYNKVGWGDYSDITSILVAEAPESPSAPAFTSASSTEIALTFQEVDDDGGSEVTGYSLFYSTNYKEASPTWTQVADYTDNAMAYTFQASDGLVANTFYAFVLKATNSKGTSDESEELHVAAAPPIDTPSAPTRDLALTTKTSIYVEWTDSTSSGIDVTGYMLYMSPNETGNF
mmetsp:Transcript_23476/g.36161  ORF Transcript_23476/g.36161 Transcript_23476/m.36161 type:complete len:276 (-) Transcript_23476:546-1373(-)